MNAFVMMPYQPRFDEVYAKAIQPALADANLIPDLVKEQFYVGAIFERIQKSIHDAVLCLADVTGGNPNVMWEAAFGQALDKPVIFIAQGTPGDVPFNIRHNNCILYTDTPEGLTSLRHAITQTAKSVLQGQGSDLELLRQMLFPNSIKAVVSPFVVATNPLTYRAAYRVSEGWKERPATTFSDYLGIRGLMRAFGMILGMQALPELVNPDDFDDAALKRAMHLYLIGSSKANRWTGLLLEAFFGERPTKWDFRPDPESRDIRNPNVIVRVNSAKWTPVDWEETSRVRKDFGIVLRGPNSHDSSLMIMVLAGRSALGTEAASLAVTDSGCLRKLRRELDHINVDPENHRQAFLAVVSVECQGKGEAFQTAVESFRVWHVAKC